MFTKAIVKTQNRLAEQVRNEEGEVASWLILAAGLAAAAVVASGIMQDLIATLAERVESEAGNHDTGGGGGGLFGTGFIN